MFFFNFLKIHNDISTTPRITDPVFFIKLPPAEWCGSEGCNIDLTYCGFHEYSQSITMAWDH